MWACLRREEGKKGRRDGGLEALVWQPETVGPSLSQEELSAASSRPGIQRTGFFLLLPCDNCWKYIRKQM